MHLSHTQYEYKNKKVKTNIKSGCFKKHSPHMTRIFDKNTIRKYATESFSNV